MNYQHPPNLPPADTPVLVWLRSKASNTLFWARACYVPQFHVEEDEYPFSGECEYNEEEDQYYWPAGWYEWNNEDDTHWLLTDEVVCWSEIEKPEGMQ